MKYFQYLFVESNLGDIYKVPSFEILNQKPEFPIFVETPTGSITTFSVRRSTPFSKIYCKLQDITGIPIYKQRLLSECLTRYFSGDTLSDYNVGPVSPPYIVPPR
jgi:hypothetical protein